MVQNDFKRPGPEKLRGRQTESAKCDQKQPALRLAQNAGYQLVKRIPLACGHQSKVKWRLPSCQGVQCGTAHAAGPETNSVNKSIRRILPPKSSRSLARTRDVLASCS